jgi:hypothetical protein
VNSYKAKELSPESTYLFSLVAVDAAGNQSSRKEVTVTTTAGVQSGTGCGIVFAGEPGFLDVGSVLELNVRADNAKDLYGFMLRLGYDPSKFNLGQVLLDKEG